jgi:hypothetical protein
MGKTSKREIEEARENLLKWLSPGDEVFCQLQHVSRSGMLRVIQVIKPEKDEDGRIYMTYLGYNVAKVLEWGYDRNKEGVRVSGCGMDMGFHLVDCLGWALWPNGYPCIGGKCTHPDHRGKELPKGGDTVHKGYALRDKWL